MADIIDFKQGRLNALRNNPVAFIRVALNASVVNWQKEFLASMFPKTASHEELDARFGIGPEKT